MVTPTTVIFFFFPRLFHVSLFISSLSAVSPNRIGKPMNLTTSGIPTNKRSLTRPSRIPSFQFNKTCILDQCLVLWWKHAYSLSIKMSVLIGPRAMESKS